MRSLRLAAILFVSLPGHAPALPSDDYEEAVRNSQERAASTVGQTDLVVQPDIDGSLPYRIQAGDVFSIAVWHEKDLETEVVVMPDGRISFPLAGIVMAAGKTIDELRNELAEGLEQFVADPVVSIAIKQIAGNRIYVLGKVGRPGEFVVSKPIDVMQALSMAGGTTLYADVDRIKILRRIQDRLVALPFDYSEVEQGKNLQQNVRLISGDILIVP